MQQLYCQKQKLDTSATKIKIQPQNNCYTTVAKNEKAIPIDLMSKVFANGPVYRCSIAGWVILKTQKMVLEATLLNPRRYKDQG